MTFNMLHTKRLGLETGSAYMYMYVVHTDLWAWQQLDAVDVYIHSL